eukprot:1368505-Prymnesium_polylepis.1
MRGTILSSCWTAPIHAVALSSDMCSSRLRRMPPRPLYRMLTPARRLRPGISGVGCRLKARCESLGAPLGVSSSEGVPTPGNEVIELRNAERHAEVLWATHGAMDESCPLSAAFAFHIFSTV